MQVHNFGHGPGLAAPEAASSVRPAGAASVAAAAASLAGLNTQKESAPAAQATQSREQNVHMNSATCTAFARVFSTLCAELALRGYCVRRSHGDDGPTCYYVSRWGFVRELRDLTAVQLFARQTGVVA